MVPRWRFLATFLHPVFAASRVQHISDLHSKFALGTSILWLLRLGKEKKIERKIETTGQKYNGLPYYIGRPQQWC